MTLSELKYIVALARERHFGRAAKVCYVSQPTLSVAVKKLEHKLGVVLFERRSGEVAVTPMGKQVVDQAQRVLQEAEVIEQLVSRKNDQLSSPLRIGAIPTVGPFLYPHLVRELARIAPDMPLVLDEQYTHVLINKLKHGELDLAIVTRPFTEQGVLTLPIYEESFTVLMPSNHPLTSKRQLLLADVEKENVLLLEEGHCLRDQVLELCPGCINSPVDTISSLETTFYMVASGLGVAIVPSSAAEKYSDKLVVSRSIDDAVSSRVVALAWRRSFPRTEALNAVHDALKACGVPGVKKA